MGGIIGAAYAKYKDISKVEDIVSRQFHGGGLFRPRKGDGLELGNNFINYIKRNLRALFIAFNLSFRKSFLRKNPCIKAVNNIFPQDTTFEELAIPLAIVTLNSTRGILETFQKGLIREPIIAGTNVGVVFPPYKINNEEYFDAAPICSIPVQQVKTLGADVVLAVDIRSEVNDHFKIYNGFDTIFRIEMIESKLINDRHADRADFLLRPDTGNIFWGDFSTIKEVISAGETATEKIITNLKEKLNA